MTETDLATPTDEAVPPTFKIHGQEVRNRQGDVVGIALASHPDQGPDAGVTHMVPVAALPEGATLGPQTNPELELAAARARIAELEASALDKAKARISALEADHAALTPPDDERVAALEAQVQQLLAAQNPPPLAETEPPPAHTNPFGG